MTETDVPAPTAARHRIFRHGPGGIRVPATEVTLTSGEAVLLYDTGGPGSDPQVGLPALRLPWIEQRQDTGEVEGRRATRRSTVT